MRSRIFIPACLLYVLLSHPAQAQGEKYFGKNLIVGTSFTWIWETSSDPAIWWINNEYTWNMNAAVSMSKRIYLGLQLLNIYTNGTSKDLQKFRMYGMFMQYNFLRRTDHRLFIETSFNRGNYCKIKGVESTPTDNLYHLGIGGGYDLPLQKILPGLYLDLAFQNYLLLNDILNTYSYTQYVIGVNYRFGKK